MNTEWKLVPVEPTDEMWAAVNKLDDEMAAGGYDGKGASIEQVWNCLVDAAPGAPAVDGWLDIASAPKTGRTLLLGYWNSLGKWRTVRGQWVSLEHIAEHWEDPGDAEAGWFETAVEADDVPNCWPVSPSHWQPMPEPPCATCNDQGAVGNILNAEPCPDCTPAPTSHPIPTGATGEEQDDSIALDKLAHYIADNWPDKKYGLEEICQRLHAMWPGEFISLEDLKKNEPNVREALRALLIHWKRFQKSDGNQQDAYNLMVKGARHAWQFAEVEINRVPVGAPAAGDAMDRTVTILPDGSAFAVASFPLPTDHWLYAAWEYEPGAEEPKELPAPILTHLQREAVIAAIRYAVRGATMCGKEQDFDPDALVQNAVYALCGPYTATIAQQKGEA